MEHMIGDGDQTTILAIEEHLPQSPRFRCFCATFVDTPQTLPLRAHSRALVPRVLAAEVFSLIQPLPPAEPGTLVPWSASLPLYGDCVASYWRWYTFYIVDEGER